MRAVLLAIAVGSSVLVTGCYVGTFGDEKEKKPAPAASSPTPTAQPPSVYEPPPSRCAPPADVWSEMRSLHDANEASVHELIKCGGLQTSISRTFLVVIVGSNRDLFHGDSYAELVRIAMRYGIDLEVPLKQDLGGRWTLPLDVGNGSSFSMVFHDPVSGAVIEQDPFSMDSYLSGVTAESTLTIDQMEQDLSATNQISFTWTEPAGLAHVLNGDKAVPNPFDIRVSLLGLGTMAFGFGTNAQLDFGPLDSVLDLEVESEVILSDRLTDTTIDYDVAGIASTLREIGSHGVAFDVKSIVARRGSYVQDGHATGLRYDPKFGHIVGRFDYRVSGPSGDLLVSDTYTGSGLDVRWTCPGG